MVRTWPVLGTADHGSSAFGAFAGYNTQWQDLILGLETNYQHTLVTLKAQNNPIARVVPAGSDTDTVSITGSGSVSNLDFLSLRARAGWVLGNFLPYGFVGFALGRADIAVAANVSVLQCPSGGGAPLMEAPGKAESCCMASPSAAAWTSHSRQTFLCVASTNIPALPPLPMSCSRLPAPASAPASNSDSGRRTIVCADQSGRDHMRLIFIATEASGRTSRLATMSLVAAAYFLKCSVSRCACAAAASS